MSAHASAAVTLRAATSEDCDQVFRWANDPVTRSVSFSSDPIPYDGHVAWFTASLDREERWLFIAVYEGRDVGLVRFDALEEPKWVEIGINVDPEARGRGLGRAMLKAASVVAESLGVETVVAYIRHGNEASRRAFEAVGYRHVRDDTSHGAPASRLELGV